MRYSNPNDLTEQQGGALQRFWDLAKTTEAVPLLMGSGEFIAGDDLVDAHGWPSFSNNGAAFTDSVSVSSLGDFPSPRKAIHPRAPF